MNEKVSYLIHIGAPETIIRCVQNDYCNISEIMNGFNNVGHTLNSCIIL